MMYLHNLLCIRLFDFFNLDSEVQCEIMLCGYLRIDKECITYYEDQTTKIKGSGSDMQVGERDVSCN